MRLIFVRLRRIFSKLVLFTLLISTATGGASVYSPGWGYTAWADEEPNSPNDLYSFYLPVSPAIQPRTQNVAWNGLLYLATSRGIYAMRADTGEVAWRYDTELPVGNTPTVASGIVYF